MSKLDDNLGKEIDLDTNFQHITYKEKMDRAKEELLATDPSKVIKWWWEEWDKSFGGIYWGKMYLIGGNTGAWKSTFLNQICNWVSEQWWKVVKYSLEDRMEDIGKEELFYETNRFRRSNGLKPYLRVDFVNNNIWWNDFEVCLEVAYETLVVKNITELDKKKQVSIDELCDLMNGECDKGTKMFAIDHLHYFEFNNSKERLDIEIKNVMHKLNEIARTRNVAIFLIAHYRNNTNWLPDPSWFRDWSAIKQVVNYIIQIDREFDDSGKSTFYITKKRGPIKVTEFETRFDINTFEYSFKKTKPEWRQEQKYI